jgi:small subunit ribosomal protein S21e
MQNAEGQIVDLYIPRKCSWSNRILTADDKGSVQINVADIDPVTGKFTRSYATFGISGYMRQKVCAYINIQLNLLISCLSQLNANKILIFFIILG